MKQWPLVVLALPALAACTIHCGGDSAPQNDAGGTPGDSGGKWDAGETGDGGTTTDGGGGQDGGQPDPNAVWTDTASNLVWRVVPPKGYFNWQEAGTYCTGLGGGFRLPSISELRSLIRGCAATEAAGSCGVKNSCLSYDICRNLSCDGCPTDEGPAGGCYWDGTLRAADGSCKYDGLYWSSSLNTDTKDEYWDVDFDQALVSYEQAAKSLHVRCVRAK